MQQLTQVRGETIEMTIDGVVEAIWLARPDAYNTINLRLTEELKAIAFDLEASRDVRVVVLRGRGRQFSAGGDIEMFQDNIKSMRPLYNGRDREFSQYLSPSGGCRRPRWLLCMARLLAADCLSRSPVT